MSDITNKYITYQEYAQLTSGNIPQEYVDEYLQKACDKIDILTFNRIWCIGYDKLTKYQKYTLKKVIANLAEFEYENSDIIDNPLSAYTLNGVKMEFSDSWNITISNGVAIKTSDYKLLESTGLTCAVIR